MDKNKFAHADGILKQIESLENRRKDLVDVWKMLKANPKAYNAKTYFETLVNMLVESKDGIRAMDDIIGVIVQHYNRQIEALEKEFELL